MNTASLASVSATPSLPNRMVSVCAALTTTLTTMSALLAASVGVFAPRPPSETNRATANNPRDGFRRPDAASDLNPCAAQRGRHAKTHRPKPDDSDAWFLRCRL